MTNLRLLQDGDSLRETFLNYILAALYAVTEEERGELFAQFCGGCHQYLGYDGICHCQNDE